MKFYFGSQIDRIYEKTESLNLRINGSGGGGDDGGVRSRPIQSTSRKGNKQRISILQFLWIWNIQGSKDSNNKPRRDRRMDYLHDDGGGDGDDPYMFFS